MNLPLLLYLAAMAALIIALLCWDVPGIGVPGLFPLALFLPEWLAAARELRTAVPGCQPKVWRQVGLLLALSVSLPVLHLVLHGAEESRPPSLGWPARLVFLAIACLAAGLALRVRERRPPLRALIFSGAGLALLVDLPAPAFGSLAGKVFFLACWPLVVAGFAFAAWKLLRPLPTPTPHAASTIAIPGGGWLLPALMLFNLLLAGLSLFWLVEDAREGRLSWIPLAGVSLYAVLLVYFWRTWRQKEILKIQPTGLSFRRHREGVILLPWNKISAIEPMPGLMGGVMVRSLDPAYAPKPLRGLPRSPGLDNHVAGRVVGSFPTMYMAISEEELLALLRQRWQTPHTRTVEGELA